MRPIKREITSNTNSSFNAQAKWSPDLLCDLRVDAVVNMADAVDGPPSADDPVAGLDVLGVVACGGDGVHQGQDFIGVGAPSILDVLVPQGVSGAKLGERSLRIFIKDVDVGNHHAKVDGDETLDEGHTDIGLARLGSALQAVLWD